MNKYLLLIITFFAASAVSYTQNYNDGCMRLNVKVLRSWNQEYEDSFADDETNWQWSVEDNSNIDALGLLGGGCLAQGGSYQIGWWNHADYTMGNFTFGFVNTAIPYSVSRYINIHGRFEGDDCGGSCDHNSGSSFFCFGNRDDYQYNEYVSTFFNYRFAAPNNDNSFTRFTTWHGSSDYGGQFTVNYSSPRPSSATASNSSICTDGSSGLVTLSATGATFGGTYLWYVGSTFTYIGSGSSITVNSLAHAAGGSSVVYHVYARNGSQNSLCYTDVTVNIVNCDFNCKTASNSLLRTIPGSTNGYNYTTVFTSGYPTGSYITDVNVSTRFIKSNPNSDIGFEIIANASGTSCTSTSLVQNRFSGNGQTVTTVLFDEQSLNNLNTSTYDPQTVSVMNPNGNLNCYNWSSPNRSWNLRVDHRGSSLFQVTGLGVEVCACKPVSSAYLSQTLTNSMTICETRGGTLDLRVSGSQSSISSGGFGDEVRWFKDGCYGAGTYVGSGSPFPIVAPTTPGTYTYFANYYLDGIACDNPNLPANECKSITITVVAEPIAGAVVQGGDIAIDICEGTSPGLFTLVGSNQIISGNSIDRWEVSSNGGTNWTGIANTVPTYNPGVLNTLGTYYYRAVLVNAACGNVFSEFFTVNVLETPDAGTTSMLSSGTTYCSDTIFSMLTSGFAGALQWQISSDNGFSFTDIPGQTTDDLNYFVTNITELPVNYLFRVKASNAPCAESFSLPVQSITVYPETQGGVLTASQDVCFNGFAADLNLVNVHGDSIIWEIDNNAMFTSPTDLGHVQKIIGLDNTLSGATIGILTSTQYVRAKVVNAYCGEAYSNTITLTNYLEPTNTISADEELCVGDVPAILIGSTPTLGNGTYTYQWQSSPIGAGTWNDIAGATAKDYNPGPYTVNTDFRRVVSSGPCTNLSSKVTVIYHLNPSFINVTPTNISCFGADDGSIAIIGLNTDSFSIDNGMTYTFGGTFNNLTPGSYNVIIKNVNDCELTYPANSVVIVEPSDITFASVVSDPSCSNSSNGSITINVTNGVGILNYSLDGGPAQTGNVFSGLIAGTYSILVTDANGCTETGSATLTDSYTLALNVKSVINPTCFGQSDGILNLGTVGGQGPFTFSIDGVNYQADSVITGLPSGLYTVYTLDANGCSATSSVTIIDGPTLLVTLDSIKSVVCNGQSTGGAYINVSGGTGVYTYLWSNGAITQDLENVPAGSYNVLVSSGVCDLVLNVTIYEPSALSLNLVSVTNVECNGDLTGGVDVSISGGTAPHSYSWSDGLSVVGTTEDLSGVGAGTYTVTITDDNACTTTLTQVITENTAVAFTTVDVNPSCVNANDGSITVNVTGGQMPYAYSINGGPLQTNNIFATVIAGTYDISVLDDNGCMDTTSITLINSYTLVLDTPVVTNVSCTGQNDGQVQLTTTGGQAPFSFTINGALAQSDSLFTGLSAGLYTFDVTDANGCTSTISTTVSENPPLVLVLDSVSNVLCSGGSTGAAYISVSGGDGSYTYSWTGAGTSSMEDLTNAIAGAYTITVLDGNGCSVTLSATISSPSVLSANIGSVSNVSCNGGSDGSIDISVSGGTPNYTFSWFDGTNVVGTTEDLSGVGTGTYVVTITDDNVCTTTLTQVITENTAVAFTTVDVDASCLNSNNGSITVNATGGQIPYTYSIDGGAMQTVNVFSGLVAGTYFISVLDDNGCMDTSSVTLTDVYTLVLDTNAITNVSCAGQNDGQVQLTTAGGQAPFSFTVNGASTQSDSLFIGLAAGVYTFEVTDANGCSSMVTATISEYPPMVLILDSVSHVLCEGGASGAAYITASGGDEVYTYSWTGAGTSAIEDLTNAIAGAYTVTILDGNGCSATLSATISSPTVLSASLVSVTDVSCAGGSNGVIDVSVSGGTTPYSYSWSNGDTLEDLSNVATGNYTLTVTDGNACVSTLVVTVGQLATLTVVGAGTNSSCSNSANGIVNFSVSGGQAPYLYSLDGGPQQTSNTFTGLSAALYTILVTDVNGCTVTGNALVLNDYTLALSSTSVSNVSCSGQNDGEVQLSTIGGEAPFTFTMNGFNSQTDSLFTGLSGGIYTFEVIDVNGCTASISETIIETPPMMLSLDSVIDVLCSGGLGAAYITAIGGDGTYTYAWTGPTLSTMEDLTNALPGAYNLVVTDGAGCTETINTNIAGPTPLLSSVLNVSDVSCNGAADGSIDVSISGGSPAYTFSWSDGSIVVGTTEDISGLSGGTYSLTVTDANGCVITLSQVILENAAIVVSSVDVNASCSNSNDGSITVNVTGGQAPYTYAINGGAIQNSNVFSGLSAGAYTIDVLDADACSSSSGSTLTNDYMLVLDTTSVTNVSCAGQNDGQVQLTTVGGQAPFNFTINGVSTQSDSLFSGLVAGFYTFEVTDANGCSSTVSATISEFPPMVLVLDSVSNVLCSGDATGAAYITTSGGDGIYTYSWTGAGTGTMEDLTNATAGTYIVTVVDGNGCSVSTSAIIASPSVLATNIGSVVNVSCNGGSDGSIDISVSGGTPTYSYSWSDGTSVVGTTEDLSGVVAGTYTVTITDDNGCTTSLTQAITENIAVMAINVDINSSCANSSNGSITVNASGGQTPYSYSINGGAIQSSNTFTGLSAGPFAISVVDANGCVGSSNSVLTNLYTISLDTSSVTNVSCAGQNDGEVQLVTTGGQAPLSYTINGALAQASSLFTGLSSGLYTFEVTDANGCSSTISTTISENPPMVISLDSVTNVLCAGDPSGAIYISVTGGDGTYTFSWSGAGTSAMEDLTSAIAGSYNVSVVDGAGCSVTLSAIISSPTVLTASLVSVNNVSCNGGTDGSINAGISGGTPNYTFSWSDGTTVVGTSEDLLGVGVGTYTLTVTDDNGCITTLTQVITGNTLLVASTTTTDILCFGGEGTASVTAFGGVAPYTYLWSTFAITSTVTALDEGMVSVIVTDQMGCSIQLFDTIHGPSAPLAISAVVQNVSCFGLNDGSITETITGGTMPYTKTWTPGGSNTSLTAGSYTLVVTDANGCSTFATYTVIQPLQMLTTLSLTHPSCFGEQTGMAVAGVTNGTAPYTYVWNTTPPQYGMVAVSLFGDTDYVLTITDANGCIAYDTAKVVNPPEIVLASNPTNVSCISTANGSVVVSAQGGNLPYEYQLNGFLQSDSVFDNLSVGNYIVFVTDNTNCSASTSFSVSGASSMGAEIEAAGNDLNFVTDKLYVVNGEEVSLNVNFTNDSGNPIVGYNWTPSILDTIINPTFMPTTDVTVQVEVLELINGSICSIFDTLQIDVSQESLIFVPTAFSPNNEGENNFFEINVLGASNLNVGIFNRWGEEVFRNETQGNGPNNVNDPSLTDGSNPRGAWDGVHRELDVPTGTYAYKIDVTYFDGSTKLITGSVTVIR